MLIGLFPLARPTFDVPFARDCLNQALQTLERINVEIVGAKSLIFSNDEADPAIARLSREDTAAILVLQVTFADAGMILALADAVTCPILVWGFPEPRWGGRPRLNALCGINLATHALRRRGHPYRFIYAAPDNAEALHSILFSQENAVPPSCIDPDGERMTDASSSAARALASISGCRMGLVGTHPDGFETCRFDRGDLGRRFGIGIENIDLSELFSTAAAFDDDGIEPVRQRAKSELLGLEEVDRDATDKSLRLYAALRKIAAERKLAGYAVRCWPEMFTDYGCAVCGALGMLNEDAIACACEADVIGNVTNLLLQAIAGTPPWVVDLVHADAADDTAVIWHCGLAPRSMASSRTPPKADIHANRRLPLLQAFALKPGRVTAARLSQADNRLTMVIAGGEMLEAPMSFCGTSGVIRFDRPVMDVVGDLLSFGLEHHISIAYGDHRATLQALAAQLDIPLIELTRSD